MNLAQILEMSKKKKRDEFDVWSMAELLEINSCDVSEPEINPISECYYFNWYCTDSIVGYSVIFFDNEIVAVSSQHGRKCSKDLTWFSQEAYHKVYDFIDSLTEKHKPKVDILSNDDLFADMQEYYTVEFTCQLLPHTQSYFYMNKPVKYKSDGDVGNMISHLVAIELDDGSITTIDVSDLHIKYF